MSFLADFSNWVGMFTIAQTIVLIGITIHKLRGVIPEEGQGNKEKYETAIEELERVTGELLLISGKIKAIEPKD